MEIYKYKTADTENVINSNQSQKREIYGKEIIA